MPGEGVSPSATAERQTKLTEQIRQVHERSRAVYGSPRVHRDLLAEDVRCSKNTVAKLMRAAGLRSKRRRGFASAPPTAGTRIRSLPTA